MSGSCCKALRKPIAVVMQQKARRTMWTGSGATMNSATNRLELEHQIGLLRRITSWDFEQRARRYRLAAVLADSQRQARTFCDLAMLFGKIARDFGEWEKRNSRARPSHSPANRLYLH